MTESLESKDPTDPEPGMCCCGDPPHEGSAIYRDGFCCCEVH